MLLIGLNESEMILLSFTASVDELTGFQIQVNVQQEMSISHPVCFFANLSGTDWTKLRNIHVSLIYIEYMKTFELCLLHFKKLLLEMSDFFVLINVSYSFIRIFTLKNVFLSS